MRCTIGTPSRRHADIVYAFAPLDLTDTLLLPPVMVDTANEVSVKFCNLGTSALDPPAQTYTIYLLTG
jgi:hypothetical protein